MLVALLMAAGLLAAPPLEGFPSSVVPAGEVLPKNGHVMAWGDRPLVLDEIGVIARVDGAVVAALTRIVGCCALEVSFNSGALTVGDDVALTISHSGVDNDFSWIVGADDVVSPTLTAATIVEIVTTSSFSPPSHRLVWGASTAAAQTATATSMKQTSHRLASRIRIP